MIIDKPTEPGLYKVVIVNKKPRFAQVSGMSTIAHKNMVQDGEIPTAAGYIGIFDNGSWKISDSYSRTLQLSIGSDEDLAILKAVLGPKYKEPYE